MIYPIVDPMGSWSIQATATTGVLYRLSNQLLSDLMDKIHGAKRLGGDPERNHKEVIF